MSRGEDAAHVLLAGVRNVQGGMGRLEGLSLPELKEAYYHTLDKVVRCAGQLAYAHTPTVHDELQALRFVSGVIVRTIDAVDPEAQPPHSEVLHAEAHRYYGRQIDSIEPYFDFTGQATRLQVQDTAH